MSDEEEDYMSDNFLAKCVPQDVRPGLKRTHATQREHELQKKKEESRKQPKLSKAQEEAEKREAGLKTQLDSSNKGFAMLAKMGYKEGESLGKSKTGRVEPVPIEIKANRSGLGREAAIQQIKEAKAKLREFKRNSKSSGWKAEQISTEDYRANLARKHREKRLEGDVFRSQKACRQLDMAKGFTEPVEKWFWPHDAQAADETHVGVDDGHEQEETKIVKDDQDDETEEEEEVEFPLDQQLVMLTDYLRTEHVYCIWCGTTFEDSEDLKVFCPGDTKEAHDDE